MSSKQDIVLSICVITYNQEKFILETLNGIFFQKIDFKCELVIFDDCSTDLTTKIIDNFISENISNYISVSFVVNSQNIGVSHNFCNALNSCHGKYIAICEGDDYWTDNNKLKKQVDFLEKNKNFVMCYHLVHFLDLKNNISNINVDKNISSVSSYYDLLCFGKYMQTCSVVFVNIFQDFPFNKLNFINDYILWFWISQFGYIYRFDEHMAVYRLGSGIWSVLSDFQKRKESILTLIEVKKIAKEKKDVLIIENRINSLTLSFLPSKLQSVNENDYTLTEFLASTINYKTLIYSLFLKFKNKTFNNLKCF
jgi:glycosyltransferase involved in cell wall biosynthesis